MALLAISIYLLQSKPELDMAYSTEYSAVVTSRSWLNKSAHAEMSCLPY